MGVKIMIDELDEFKPWTDEAIELWESLTSNEKQTLDAELENVYPEGLTTTELNDLLRFEQVFVHQLIGRPVPLDLDSTDFVTDFDFNSWEDIMQELNIESQEELLDKFKLEAYAEVLDKYHERPDAYEFLVSITYGSNNKFMVQVFDDDDYGELSSADKTAIALQFVDKINELCGNVLPWGEKVTFQKDFE